MITSLYGNRKDKRMAAILVLDDDPDIRLLLKRYLTERGHLPLIFEKTRHAELSLDTLKPDLAMLDINLPGEGTASASAGGCGRPGRRFPLSSCPPNWISGTKLTFTTAARTK